MKLDLSRYTVRFAVTATVAFVAAALTMYVWNLIFTGTGKVAWATSFVLSIAIALVSAWRTSD
jgi:hypothetical protein